MIKLRTVILFLFLLSISKGYSQEPKLARHWLEEGYNTLDGHNGNNSTIKAKRNFNKARCFFFFKSSVVKDAKLGLYSYYIEIEDTIHAIKMLRSTLGNSICNKIESSDFSTLTTTDIDDDQSYNACKNLIKIALAQNNYTLANNYLEYLKEYVNVSWYCGLGKAMHDQFIESVEQELEQ